MKMPWLGALINDKSAQIHAMGGMVVQWLELVHHSKVDHSSIPTVQRAFERANWGFQIVPTQIAPPRP